jgi:hypothetical protein
VGPLSKQIHRDLPIHPETLKPKCDARSPLFNLFNNGGCQAPGPLTKDRFGIPFLDSRLNGEAIMTTREQSASVIPVDRLEKSILSLRGLRVILDANLAALYGVTTKRLNGVETRVLKQAVKRNIRRFPPDFMFELTKDEFENWRSQFVTSSGDKMGLRYAPIAFTEHGVAMFTPFNAQPV